MSSIEGIVESGVGRGATFIAIPVYHEIFEDLLEDTPFPGTLNVKLKLNDAEVVNQAFETGIVHENLEYDGRSYGGIVVIPLEIIGPSDNIRAVGVRPHLTSHTSDILEIVSGIHLRSSLDLKDGNSMRFILTK